MADVVHEFLRSACVEPGRDHRAGGIEAAIRLLALAPDVPQRSVHAAAALGDADAVRAHVEREPSLATSKGGPHGWDALTHLCFSNFLRLDRARSPGFVRAARALLDAGADARTGFREENGDWESALYGAAGVAHDAELARLLVARGADVNDGEVVYHTPESDDNAALRVLLGTRGLTRDSLAIVLVRKLDWHDLDGVRLALAFGAEANHAREGFLPPLHHAITRGNDVALVELLLDRGADASTVARGSTAVGRAARHGRGDLLAAFERRGVPVALAGVEGLLALAARGEAEAARRLAETEPALRSEILAIAGETLARFALTGNAEGARILLDLGMPVDARYVEGFAYFGIAPASTALHVAAWLARHDVVRVLLERGARVHARDARGVEPLALAVRACVDSHWTHRRSPESVEALLAAGAQLRDVARPTGYDAVDEALARGSRRE